MRDEKTIKYLKVLGLSTTGPVDENEIKKAFRNKAKIYHPDTCEVRYKDGKMFILIQEAKDYLLENLDYINNSNYSQNKNDYENAEKKAREERARQAREKAESERKRREADEKERKARERAEQEKRRRDSERKAQEEKERKVREAAEKRKARIEEIKEELKSYVINLDANKYSKNNYKYIVDMVTSFVQYLDSSKHVEAEYIKIKEKLDNVPTKIQQRKNRLITSIVFGVIIMIVGLWCFTTYGIPNIKYNNAIELIEEGKYTEAKDILYDLDNYKDSRKHLHFIEIRTLFDSGHQEDAVKEALSINANIYIKYAPHSDGVVLDEKTNFLGLTFNVYSKKGYVFQKYEYRDYEIDVELNRVDIFVEPKYRNCEITYVFEENGETLEQKESMIPNEKFTLLSPTKKDYAFSGWYTESGEKFEEGIWDYTSDIILYARWQKSNISISYYDESSLLGLETVKLNQNYQLMVPIKQGFIFVGWYTKEGALVSSSGSNWNILDDVNLYAKWVKESIKINYYDDNELISSVDQNVYQSYDLLVPTKKCYKFIGWHTKEGALVSSSGTNWEITEDINLYARWERESILISYYDYDEGLLFEQEQNVYGSYTLFSPKKDNFRFIGWYTEGGIHIPNSGNNLIIYDNIKLYAKWERESYNVSYYDQFGEFYHKEAISLNSKYELFVPEKKGYEFMGWYTEDGELVSNSGNVWMFVNDINLYAKWTNVKYEITINGTITEKQSVFYNESFKLPINNIKENAIFLGYFCMDNDIETQVTNQTGISLNYYQYLSDLTVYPKYNYSVLLVLNNGKQEEIVVDETSNIENLYLPIKQSYTFDGWYFDKDFKNKYTENSILENCKLYAKWKEEISPEDLNYDIIDGSVKINNYDTNYTDKKLTIPSYISGYPVRIIEESFLEGDTQIEEIVLPSTIIESKYNAFYNCNLQKINYLGTIDEWVEIKFNSKEANPTYTTKNLFINNVEVLSIEISNASKISKYAFVNLSKVESIKVGKSVELIEEAALIGCSSLKDLSLPFVGQNDYDDIDYPFGYIFGQESFDGGELTNQYTNFDGGIIASYYVPTSLKTVEVLNEMISSYDFMNCKNIESILLTDNIKNISDNAFDGCDNLVLNVYENGKYLGSKDNKYIYLFDFETSEINEINEFIIHEDTLVVQEGLFKNLINLTTVELSKKLVEIKNDMFYGCSSLQNITIPENVTRIGDYAFYNCNKITSVEIPTSVTSIGKYAFGNCLELTTIELPNSIEEIGEAVFTGCSKLESLTLPFIGNVKDETQTSKVYPLGYIFGSTNYTESKSVTQNYYDVESSSSKVVTYYVPSTLTSVTVNGQLGYGAFYNLSNLTNVTLDKEITSIPNYTFYNCIGLTNITIPENVTRIGDYAFYNCKKITSVEIPTRVTSIGKYACGNCYKLMSITLPNSVTNIGKEAFAYCTDLPTIELPDSIKEIENGTFIGCFNLESIIIPNTVKFIGEQAFYSCGDLSTIELPDSIKNIGKEAFGMCDNLINVELPSSLEKIDDLAFNGCSNLETIEIPSNILSVGCSVFEGCNKLTLNTYNKGLYLGNSTNKYLLFVKVVDSTISTCLINVNTKHILNNAFSNCSQLSSIEIPSNVMSIGDNAFSNCQNLNAIEINENIKMICKDAFYDCINLKDVYFNGDVASWIDIKFENGFSNPTHYFKNLYIFDENGEIEYGGNKYSVLASMSDVILKETRIIKSNSFVNFKEMVNVVIPNTVLKMEDDAFFQCNKLENVYYNGTLEEWCNIEWGNDYSSPMYYAKNLYILDENGTVVFNGKKYTFLNYMLDGELILENIITIMPYTFKNCTNLTSIVIPESVTKIGLGAFQGCSYLENMTIPFVGSERKTSSDTYQYPFGYIFGTSSFTGGTATKQYYYGFSITSTSYSTYYIPTSLKKVIVLGGELLYGAFYNCNNLTNVVVSASVEHINYSVFIGCNHLESMTIPFVGSERKVSNDTYQYPFGYIFGTSSYTGSTATQQYYYGSSITSTTSSIYYIPTSLKKVTVLGGELLYGAFYNCTFDVILSDGITSIGQCAFLNYKGQNIEIPVSVKEFKSNSFEGAVNLNNVYYDGTLEDWCNIEWGNDYSSPMYYAKNLYILDENGAVEFNGNKYTLLNDTLDGKLILENIITIMPYTFMNCTNLTSITIPNSVTSIGDCAFFGCSNLQSITTPDSVTSIGKSTFYGCSNLESITIPGLVTSIGDYAFYNCSNLESITIPASVTSIGYCAFNECSNLQSITIPDSVKIIGDYAFHNCSSLTSIEIGDSVTSIGRYVFYYCTSLTSIVIPKGVTNIGEYAFYYCKELTSIVLPESVTSIEGYAFNYCYKVEKVYYNGSLEKWNDISINSGNSNFTSATCYYYSESKPLDEGNYWHYDEDGSIIEW